MDAILSKANYAENLLPYAATFEEIGSINKAAGSVDSTITYNTSNSFDGNQCIESYNDTPSVDLVFTFPGLLTTTAKRNGLHKFSFALKQNQNPNQYTALKFKVEISIGGVFSSGRTILVTLPTEDDADVGQTNLVKDKWYVFSGDFTAQINDVIDFRFTHLGVDTVPDNSTFYLDGLSLIYNDKLFSFPPVYQKPTNIIKQTQVIDFDSVAAGAINTKTFAFTVAKTYNQVSVLPTPAIRALGGTFVAWCGTDGNVSVKYTNNTGSTIDLPSDNYIITLTK